jgi:hypothetical protein
LHPVAYSDVTSPPRFLGRQVTIQEPQTDADGFFPKGSATICLSAPPQKQCLTAPSDYGRVLALNTVRINSNLSALYLEVASGGVSGFAIQSFLLRPGTGANLEDLFGSDTRVSNQSQREFWDEPGISEAKVFVEADYVWGPGEAHYDSHRYMISAYVWKHSDLTDDDQYYLEDRYLTIHKYDLEAQESILADEKQEILARLRRINADHNRQPATGAH